MVLQCRQRQEGLPEMQWGSWGRLRDKPLSDWEVDSSGPCEAAPQIRVKARGAQPREGFTGEAAPHVSLSGLHSTGRRKDSVKAWGELGRCLSGPSSRGAREKEAGSLPAAVSWPRRLSRQLASLALAQEPTQTWSRVRRKLPQQAQVTVFSKLEHHLPPGTLSVTIQVLVLRTRAAGPRCHCRTVIRMRRCTAELQLKAFPQSPHLQGFSPVWVL